MGLSYIIKCPFKMNTLPGYHSGFTQFMNPICCLFGYICHWPNTLNTFSGFGVLYWKYGVVTHMY